MPARLSNIVLVVVAPEVNGGEDVTAAVVTSVGDTLTIEPTPGQPEPVQLVNVRPLLNTADAVPWWQGVRYTPWEADARRLHGSDPDHEYAFLKFGERPE